MASAPYPSPVRAWGVVLIFCLASVVSVIDRGILTLVVDPVRRDLGISDLQIGLLQGLSFGLFYATVGIPLGLMADRLSRHRLLMAGIAMWSAATILGGFATHFGTLFVSRLLAGLGEATLGPCAVSMISDMFPPERRGRPFSIYLLGQAIGPGIGIFLTSLVLRGAGAGSFVGLPLLGGLAPWRLVFVLCGAFGLLVVLLMLSFREPVRRGVAGQGQRSRFRDVWGYLRENWTVFLPFYLGFSVVAMHTYGLSGWNATYLIRTFGASRIEVGQWLGLASMLGGGVGALTAGFVADRVARSGTPVAKMKLLIAICALALPSTLLAFAPNLPVGLAMVVLSVAAMPMFGTTMVSTIPEIMPGDMRGVAVSIMGLSNTLLGSTMGPLLIALATEKLYKDPALVGASATTVGVPVMLLGAALYSTAAFTMGRKLSRPGRFRTVVEAARR